MMESRHVVLVLVYLLAVQESMAIEGESSCDQLKLHYGRSWIYVGQELKEMEADGIKVRFCHDEDVTIQVYQKSTNGNYEYKLLWQQMIHAGSNENQTIPLDESLTIRRGSYIAVYPHLHKSTKSTHISVATIKTAGQGNGLLHNANAINVFNPGDDITFSDLTHPFRFHIEFCEGCVERSEEEDTDESEGNEEGIDDQFTMLPPETHDYECKPDQSDLLSSGNKVALDRSQLVTGMVRAVKTYFCVESSVYLQIWKPTDTASAYDLIWQKTVEPSSALGHSTVVNLASSEQIYVEEGYLFGAKAADPTSDMIPIPTMFDLTAKSVRSMTSTQEELAVGSTETFDDLPYPAGFYITFCRNSDCAGGEGNTVVKREDTAIHCKGGQPASPESDDDGGSSEGEAGDDVNGGESATESQQEEGTDSGDTNGEGSDDEDDGEETNSSNTDGEDTVFEGNNDEDTDSEETNGGDTDSEEIDGDDTDSEGTNDGNTDSEETNGDDAVSVDDNVEDTAQGPVNGETIEDDGIKTSVITQGTPKVGARSVAATPWQLVSSFLVLLTATSLCNCVYLC